MDPSKSNLCCPSAETKNSSYRFGSGKEKVKDLADDDNDTAELAGTVSPNAERGYVLQVASCGLNNTVMCLGVHRSASSFSRLKDPFLRTLKTRE